MANSSNTKKVLDNFSKIMSSLGDYLISIGNVEKGDPEFKLFLDKMKSDSSYFDRMIKEMPPELSKEFLFIFIKMTALQDKAKEIDKLSPDDKIKLGKELKELGKKLKELYEKINSLKLEK